MALLIPASPAHASPCFPGCLQGSLSDSLDFLSSGPLGQAEVAALVTTVDRGDTLVSIQPERRLIPGSNVKLFTTGSFLKRYGVNYRRPTLLLARGKASPQKDGTEIRFKGDLVLRASGMPDVYQLLSPGSRGLLDSLAFLLRAGGVTRFQGTVWIDGSVFASESYGPGWGHDDFAYAYGAPINAVLANGNATTLIATSTPRGVTYQFDPPEVSLVARGRPTVGNAGTPGHLDVSRAPGSRVLEVIGTVPRGGMVKRQVAVVDPDSTAGLMLLGAMKRMGIEVDASVRVLKPADEATAADVERMEGLAGSPADSAAGASARGWTAVDAGRVTGVVSLLSPPASDVVGIVNAMSLNAEAEALLRLLDPASSGKQRERGLVELMRIVGESGVDTVDLSLVDGSGLSPMDLATPRAIVTWLRSLDRDPEIGPAFRAGLARPGALGTLKNRFGVLDTKADLHGKTGTLTNVSALSGFVTRADGERTIFSILSNGNRNSVSYARDAEEKLVSLLARTSLTPEPTSAPIGIPR
ncbi:MAG: D-alanyl-D-alanine carboxypeptidase/D-alanyl-D-alanine-endopeptidase [Candidatus Eiseniibacteriota bacterium]